MDASFWVAMASIWAVFGIACAVIANSKGRNPVGWFFVGVLLGLIGLIIILALPRTIENEAARAAQLGWAASAGAPLPYANALAARCPFCAEQIQPEAVVCRWCGRDLPQGAAIAPPAVPGPASFPGVAPPAPVVLPVTRTVVEPGASVRDTPAGSAVAHLPAGTRVTAHEQSGAWVRVEGPGGAAGWLRESDLLGVRAPGTPREG